MMFLVVWVVVGLIAGLIVNRITGQSRALIGDIILGIVGSVVGGFVPNVLGARHVVDFNLLSVPCAGLGALLVLVGFYQCRRAGHGFLSEDQPAARL